MKKIFLFTFLIFACLACKKSEDPSLLKEFIIGKWQVIAQGPTEESVEPITPGNAYTEYFRDGTMGYYGWLFELGDYGYIKYNDRSCRMDEVYLYVEYPGNSENNEIDEYSYDKDSDLLTLKLIEGMIPGIYPYPYIKVYQRIK